MKVFSNVCSFDYSWEEVSTANWRKYCPWNDKSTHVISVDTISRHVDPETGVVSIPRDSNHPAEADTHSAPYRTTYHMQTECTCMVSLSDGWKRHISRV